MRLFFLWLLLALLASVQTPAAEPAGMALAEVRSVQADFQQEKHLKILARPIISRGTFLFQAPQSLRWEYRSPIRSVLLMHGGKVRKFVERDGEFREDGGMGLDSMQVVLAQIADWLDGRFTDNDMFSVSYPDERTLLLTPKGQALAGLISNVQLELADQKGLLDRVTIFEGPDSYTAMTFTNRTLNQEIPAVLFAAP
jgi:outer membrane lipoprotein-sorting protein